MNTPLNINPQPSWVGWALLPARIVVAAFLHLEQAMKPEVTEDFGHMFRAKSKANGDTAAIIEAVERFDAKYGRRS